MDRALDDIIGERQSSSSGRGGGGFRPSRGNYGHESSRRGGYRKTESRHDTSVDNDWLHDKYDDEDDYGSQPVSRYSRDRRPRDPSPQPDLFDKSAKLRVENVHYDLTEEDLRELFSRIAPVLSLSLNYDRSGRSTGTAYVTYRDIRDARDAVTEFDGANANGQPIRLSVIPSAPAQKRNPFDSVIRPVKSLAERIERSNGHSQDRRSARDRSRSRSPGERRSNARRTNRDDIDRYVPNDRERSRSPRRGRGRGGARGRGRGRGGRFDEEGRPIVGGRPRFTQEQLDKDMDDYWGPKDGATDGNAIENNGTVQAQADHDIDMVE